jgi:hypothetical protein
MFEKKEKIMNTSKSKSIVALFMSLVIGISVFAATYVDSAAAEFNKKISFYLGDYLLKDSDEYMADIKDTITASSSDLHVSIDMRGAGETVNIDNYTGKILDWFAKYESRINHITLLYFDSAAPLSRLSKFTKLERLDLHHSVDEGESFNYSGFPDLPSVTSLYVLDDRGDIKPLFKHFPNLKDFSLGAGNYSDHNTISMMKALLSGCPKLKTFGGGKLIDNDTYQLYFDNELRKKIDKGNYAALNAEGIIRGKFAVTIKYEDETIAYRGSELAELLSTDDYAEQYARTSGECDTYVLITVNDDFYGDYDNGITKGYSREFYVQIFDIKNKISYKKVLIEKALPAETITYYNIAPSTVYGKTPQKLYDYIEAACKAGKV